MNVAVNVAVGVSVAVAVFVEVTVAVRVAVSVGVEVLVDVQVAEGVADGIRVAVAVAVSGGARYSTSIDRKSTYPPEAAMDQVRQPVGTVMTMLTYPGRLPALLYIFQVLTAEQARSVALPTFESLVNSTMISK